MEYIRELWLWLGKHATVVVVIIFCVALVLVAAILSGANVTGFFQMIGGWFGLGQ